MVFSVCSFLLVGGASTAAGNSPAGRRSGSGPLRFVLDTPLKEGGKTAVKLQNHSEKKYRYNPYYEACEMTFRFNGGREFLVPEGTHCDLDSPTYVAPGQTVTLFKWDLDECVKDEWGCTKARDLPPRRYVMRGWFTSKDGENKVRVTRRFRIFKDS
jgi:hypothetical protein